VTITAGKNEGKFHLPCFLYLFLRNMEKFHENQIYHVFNQGNNRQVIFREHENYLFFLRKVRKYLIPYCDFLCYCLMPNHFHFLIVPNRLGRLEYMSRSPVSETKSSNHTQNLSYSLGLLLSSYAKAYNKRYERSGSLFRQKTKVKDGWIDQVITVDGKNRDMFFRFENDYALQCFHYIHKNPVKANLVKKATDWEYSSARDYHGLRNGTLCNKDLADEIFGLQNLIING